MYPILISPIPELPNFSETQEYDLLLSHLFAHPEYIEFYTKKRQNRPNSFFILDNSAHEFQTGQSLSLLLDQAKLVGANEIVLPDTLFDSDRTWERTKEAMMSLSMNYKGIPECISRVMIVPQGKTLDEYLYCFRRMYDDYQTYLPFTGLKLTLGISKDYHEMFDGGVLTILNRLVPALDYNDDIHLLGWPLPLQDLYQIAQEYGVRIRSTDTARMFTYAMSEVDLFESQPKYPKRPADFFTRKLTEEQRRLAYINARFYRDLAGEGAVDFLPPIFEVIQ